MREPETAVESEKQKSGPLQTVLNVVGAVLCVLFIPVIILNVVMIVRSYADPDHIASVFGYSPVIVLSGSMSPTFEAGDMIILEDTDPYTLQVGDVVCYMEEESAVTHRIIEIQQQDGEPLFITQGDANNAEDATPVLASQIEGKYNGVRLKSVGYFANFLQTTEGRLIFIGGPILLFVLWDVIRRMLQSRRDKQEKERLTEASASKEEEMAAMEEELKRLRERVGEAPPEDGGQP